MGKTGRVTKREKKLIVGSVVWEFMVLKERTFIPPKMGISVSPAKK